jgi:hypothetical protein
MEIAQRCSVTSGSRHEASAGTRDAPAAAPLLPDAAPRRPIQLVMLDVVMVQCWLFALELRGGASYSRFLLLIEDFPPGYRPRARA